MLNVTNPWFSGTAEVPTYTLSELLGATPVARAQIEANMADKMVDATFLDDVSALLRTGLDYDPCEAWARVQEDVITKLPGEPWRGGIGS